MQHISQHLSLSSEPQKQELSLRKTGDELTALEYAIKQIKINVAPQEHLKEVLRLIMVKVGLRANNWPQAEEKAVLLSHIVSNYGGHTPQEVLLAFDMAMLGQLPVDINHFENFSCAYFSSIMNAYRGWAKENYRIAVKEVPQIEHKEDLSDKAMSEWYEDTKNKVKAGLHFGVLPIMIYDWLDKKGEIKISNKEKFSYMDNAARFLEEIEQIPTVEAVKNTAKRMILNDKILKNQ